MLRKAGLFIMQKELNLTLCAQLRIDWSFFIETLKYLLNVQILSWHQMTFYLWTNYYFSNYSNGTKNSRKPWHIKFGIWQRIILKTLNTIYDTLFEEVNSTNFLLMYMDKGLTWNSHVDHLCVIVASGVFVLNNLQRVVL